MTDTKVIKRGVVGVPTTISQDCEGSNSPTFRGKPTDKIQDSVKPGRACGFHKQNQDT